MHAVAKIEPEQRRRWLGELPDWRHDAARDAIARRFRFADFAEAFAFMLRLALYAEKNGHHPEWSNVYDWVEIVLTTHDAGGLTQRDIDFARYADQVYRGGRP